MGSASQTEIRMGWTAPPAAPRCPACKTSVYPAESVMAMDRTPFHRVCVKCKSCGKTLNTTNLNEHNTQLYCKACYEGLFDAHDYHTAQYGGIVTPEDIKRREEEERKRLEKLERQKNERRCPGCDMKAFPEDNTPMMLGPKNVDNVFGDEELIPFCKFCFAKKFKISALNIAETVTTVPELVSQSL